MKMNNIMKQAQKMQAQMERVQASLADDRVEGNSGGGMVTATANGHGEILSLKITPEVVDPEDIEMLEDLVLAAVNDAARKGQELAKKKMGQITGGLGGALGGLGL
ncbi:MULTISPECIES: YbaB/EbfC family nucleoid-associated protein [Dethiosulfovibrio]|uniref:Nucleoid-associated protein L2W38_04435 n=2 Tax=Dethiosulfovibrio TaxID=47054 RepID=A0ABS9ELI3_9BACT|nr:MULTISPECIES: YbaB/EbfC family nucleoid-associated protein [Dethiosulfovibrio]MCF4113593.1 YbaB/EbfC family nucleoid-associated protein [Dethiosulfovibrio russensis]MCF4142063.1 YbaB/EbfC family nucleoid-associated protein [Dethiosulfovibrio marinus]MCF4144218.1 YbaB/EbfC family nucleoid-associated protein [Dethiosulfovibrio acidaminovorans]